MKSSKSQNMYVTGLSKGSLPHLKNPERIRTPHKKIKKDPYPHKILTERVRGVKNVRPLTALTQINELSDKRHNVKFALNNGNKSELYVVLIGPPR